MGHGQTIAGDLCVVHGYHYPKPTRTVSHHIVPQEFGGPDVAENRVWVCDTGHYNIHEVIRLTLSGHTPPKVTRSEQALAVRGLDGIAANKAKT